MKKLLVALFSFINLSVAFAGKDHVKVVNLRCENLSGTVVIDDSIPRFSWEILSDGRDIRQKSYRILVASSLENLNNDEGDIWDSRKIKSSNSIYVAFAGKKLNSRTEYFWKVKVVTNRGKSAWSDPASWTMGLTDENEWQAKWTGLNSTSENDVLTSLKTRLAARYFRKEFNVAKKVEKATLYISGLGLYEAYINAGRIGEQVLSPTPTDYSKAVKYNTFDVTGQLSEGSNAIGVILGNGRFFSMRYKRIRDFGLPRMILQLEIKYADGSSQSVISDESWKVTADGPVLANNEFDGEEYDARKEFPGWTKPGFDDSGWTSAEIVDPPGGKLRAQTNKNIKIMETLRPQTVFEQRPGVFIMDMGQNMVGWIRMKVKGKAGDEVQLRFAELLDDDSALYTANLRRANVTDKYILKGDTEETWEPSFVYHGFRFVEISGFPGKPELDNFEGCVIFDEIETTGTFQTSDETINQIYKNALWGIKGNYRGMPTDCPQRDERMGWLGDRATGSHGESFIFNINNLYAKWLDDIEQSQRDDGSISDVVPNYWSRYSDNMTWPGAYIIIANMLYEQYGDRKPIEKHYASMKKWINYMEEKYLEDSIMTKDTYGDWCMPPESPEMIHSKDPARKTDGAVLATAFYYRMLCFLHKFALILSLDNEADNFAKQAENVKNAFNNKYFNRQTGQYSNNTVTANILPLCFGMTPEESLNDVFKNIVDKTLNEHNGHVSVGLVGIQWLMRGLSEYGRPDIACRIATNTDYPSWGYMIEKGATTVWELWNGNTADPAMNSGNHVMLLGDLIIWFYEYLAGIRNAPNSAAFEEIVMKPYIVDGLDYVKASYKSTRGLVKSEWSKTGGQFVWNITVPCNATATIYVPVANSKSKVTESGKKISASTGVKLLKRTDSHRIFRVKSGNYSFRMEQ
ncbi:MAG: glycoside hydrolase family 78 protein [Prevotellaceae bacterium]|jgi:alpha-L-rhamnosidase|nr:glycoside hydrolase family 78 protein [Prevotellaceae bacterium]